MDRVIDSLIGLVSLIAIFGALALLGFLGREYRRTYEFGKRGLWRQRGQAGCVVSAIAGLLLVTLIVVFNSIFNWKIAAIVAGAILIPIILGWFGRIIVPESFGED